MHQHSRYGRLAAAATAAALVLGALGASGAPLWGHTGHQLTAQVGTGLLSPEAQSMATQILGGESLVSAVTWADKVKYEKGYEWSKPLHFVNTPDWACTYAPSDCPGQMCAVGAIRNYTQRLSTQTGQQQQEALKFLIHIVGDVHQPLHVGFGSDYGGNEIEGAFFGDRSNLHEVWDWGIIGHRLNASFGGSQERYGEFLLGAVQAGGTFGSNATAWTTCQQGSETFCPEEWAAVSASLACTHAYTDSAGSHVKDGFSLGQAYYNYNWNVVDEQLAKSGVRMAFALNKILGALYYDQAAVAMQA